MVAVLKERRALISGRLIDFSALDSIPWRIFWLTATGVRLPYAKWVIGKFSVMLVIMVFPYYPCPSSLCS
jgi:hypothetical protein